MNFYTNIGPFQHSQPATGYGVPIGPYVGIPSGETLEAAGSIAATSSVTGHLSLTHAVSGRIDGQSLVVGRVQWKAGVFIPGQVLAEPYPVPQLDRYIFNGRLPQGFEQWAADFVRWREEHMMRIFRDLGRIGQEKASQWTET